MFQTPVQNAELMMFEKRGVRNLHLISEKQCVYIEVNTCETWVEMALCAFVFIF